MFQGGADGLGRLGTSNESALRDAAGASLACATWTCVRVIVRHDVPLPDKGFELGRGVSRGF